MKKILISGNTDPGKRRKENQDAWIARQLWSADKALLAVIDGVGGYTGGEKAAAIARDSIQQYMQEPKGDTLTMLREAVIFANNRIVEERKQDQLISEMCCVLTAVVADISAQCIWFAHVGDTRLYRYRNGNLQKLTRDHSFVGIREDAGEMTELEAMRHPHRNQILREVGSALHRLDDEDFMDYGREDFLPGDLLLLCSDGLTDMITGQQIATLLSATQPLHQKVNGLIALANEMGGHDNITVVLLQRQAAAVKKQEKKGLAPSVESKATTTPSKADHEAAHSSNQVAGPVADSPLTTDNSQSPYSPPKLLWAALILLLVAGAGWYFSPPKKATATVPETNRIDSNRTTPVMRISHPAVPGPVIEEKTDTLRITSPLNWKYLEHYADSAGKTLVLIPAKNSARGVAVNINEQSAQPGDTLLIKNIRIKNFETGIKIQIPVLLKTENLLFENTRYPFHHLVKPDSNHTSLLIMNNDKR